MCCVNAVSRWSCIWVSFTCLGWRHSLDEGVKQWGRLFKAKESDRSSRVNEYAVCCHALFLCPAVVLRRKRGKTLSRSGLAASADTQTPRHPDTQSHQWCRLYETYVVFAAQTHIVSLGCLDFVLRKNPATSFSKNVTKWTITSLLQFTMSIHWIKLSLFATVKH